MPSDLSLLALAAAVAGGAWWARARGLRDLERRGDALAASLGLAPDPAGRRTDLFRAVRLPWRGRVDAAEVRLSIHQWRAGGWAVVVDVEGPGGDAPLLVWFHRRWIELGLPAEPHPVPGLDGWLTLGERAARARLDADHLAGPLTALCAGAWHVRLGPDRLELVLPLSADDAQVTRGARALIDARALVVSLGADDAAE